MAGIDHRATGAARPRLSRTSTCGTILGVLIVVAVIIRSGYALATVPAFPSTNFLVGILALGGSAFAVLRTDRRLTVPESAAYWFLLAFMIAPVLSGAINGRTSMRATLASVLTVVAAYSISRAVSVQTFAKWWVGTSVVLVAIALAAHVVFVWNGAVFPGEVVTNSNGARYFNGLVVFLLERWDGTPSSRAMGPFWEPGIFASVLIVALLLETCMRMEPARKAVVTTLVAGVIISQSTAGYLLLIPILLLIIVRKVPRLTAPLGVLTIGGASVLLLNPAPLVSHLISVSPTLFGKLAADQLAESTRLLSSRLNLYIFWERPFFGWTASGADVEYLRLMEDWGAQAQTSTSTYFLAAYGVVGGLYTLAWLVAILANRDLAVFPKIAFSVCILVILNKEPHFAMLSSWLLLFYLLRAGFESQGRILNV